MQFKFHDYREYIKLNLSEAIQTDKKTLFKQLKDKLFEICGPNLKTLTKTLFDSTTTTA